MVENVHRSTLHLKTARILRIMIIFQKSIVQLAPVGVLPPYLARDTPEVVSLHVVCCRDQELEGARNTRFKQIRATESVIPYILCGLYFLRW
jgi:hypothetical protein